MGGNSVGPSFIQKQGGGASQEDVDNISGRLDFEDYDASKAYTKGEAVTHPTDGRLVCKADIPAKPYDPADWDEVTVEVVDSLTSTSTTDALSAAKGKELRDALTVVEGQISVIQGDITTIH